MKVRDAVADSYGVLAYPKIIGIGKDGKIKTIIHDMQPDIQTRLETFFEA